MYRKKGSACRVKEGHLPLCNGVTIRQGSTIGNLDVLLPISEVIVVSALTVTNLSI